MRLCIVVAFVLCPMLPATVHAACSAPSVGQISDTIIQMVESGGAAGIGPSSVVDGTKEGAFFYDSAADAIKYCDGTNWVTLANTASTGAAGVSGDIQFNSGGLLAADTGQLFWDATNSRLGLGTTNPDTDLHVDGGSSSGVIRISSDGHTGLDIQKFVANNDAIINLNDEGNLRFYTSATEQLRISANGNVGIGTASPAYPLQVAGAVSATTMHAERFVLSGLSGAYLQVQGGNPLLAFDGNDYLVYNRSGDFLAFFLGGSERFRVASTGNVGIGTTTPSYKLHVSGQVAGSGAYVNTSDLRLKKGIEELPYGLDTVMRLRPISFEWKEQDADWQEGRKLGLVAQAVEDVVPEVVSTAADEMGTKSIAYGDLVPVLIRAVQELKAANDNLQGQIDALRSAAQ